MVCLTLVDCDWGMARLLSILDLIYFTCDWNRHRDLIFSYTVFILSEYLRQVYLTLLLSGYFYYIASSKLHPTSMLIFS